MDDLYLLVLVEVQQKDLPKRVEVVGR